MTTVTYKNEIMAADAQIWMDNQTAWYEAKKIYRLADRSLFGAAGIVDDIQECVRWLDKKGPRPKRKLNVEGILVKQTGHVFVVNGVELHPAIGDYFAVGAGVEAALGAMFAGASAKRAVLAAAKHSLGTSHKVHTKRLHPR